jgi:hypothetical protein
MILHLQRNRNIISLLCFLPSFISPFHCLILQFGNNSSASRLVKLSLYILMIVGSDSCAQQSCSSIALISVFVPEHAYTDVQNDLHKEILRITLL